MHSLNILSPVSGEQSAPLNIEHSNVNMTVVRESRGRRRRSHRHQCRCPFSHDTHTRRDTSTTSSDDENNIDDDDHRHNYHHNDHDGRLKDEDDDDVMKTKEILDEEDEYQQHQHQHHQQQPPPTNNLNTNTSPRTLIARGPKASKLCSREAMCLTPPPSPQVTTGQHQDIPQYLRDNVKLFILQQLQVSERRKHTDKLELVHKFITSLEDQVYSSVTTQEEYISKLATRLAAILAHLTTTRRYNTTHHQHQHHHNTKTRLHNTSSTTTTNYLRQGHITSFVATPVSPPPPPPTTSADLHPVVVAVSPYYTECRSLPST
ncbi:hypothetical protein Pmani_025027 [Petrolisthes manimaculis]|uniref:Uncharacterized protein n=1 Tax=Petrolisthes manimaculis TaxID=1843537 RepID=A0AAE1P8S8_9EUCA|nr:hypothetical protein Pmani_025027 [Petrolisthes manimaculis]